MSSRRIIIATSVVVGLSLLAVLVTLVSLNPKGSGDKCPQDYKDKPPVVLVSLDGFRASYMKRNLTPTLATLAQEGVSAPYMYPSYPTVTFPNHYTIVTGLYPESHGIIANYFFDPDLNQSFSIKDPLSKEGMWWGGEPLWNTVTKQGGKSATYFWPGADAVIEGLRPTYWLPYNSSTPFEDRVDQVLAWLALPPSERPQFITLYFNEPDNAGHGYGPDSAQVNTQLAYLDSMLARLVGGMEEAGISDCVNLVVLSDHGMATGGEHFSIDLEALVPDVQQKARVVPGAFARLQPTDGDPEAAKSLLQQLSCKRPDLRQFAKGGLPRRWHFSNDRQHRIEDIVLDMDPGRTVPDGSGWVNRGNHGYDNYHPAMNALFAARGPGFQRGRTVAPFQNQQLYHLLCHLLQLVPAANNGTYGALHHLLLDPSPLPTPPPAAAPPVSPLPADDVVAARLHQSDCSGDLDAVEPWLQSLRYTTEEEAAIKARHIPWGAPEYRGGDDSDVIRDGADVTLLLHDDHVTGYSKQLKLPVWTSFTLDARTLQGGAQSVAVGRLPDLLWWGSDPRLSAQDTLTCRDYSAAIRAQSPQATMRPLFPQEFTANATQEKVPLLLSNALPSSAGLLEPWSGLLSLLEGWLGSSMLHVVMGPVFDADHDSIQDDYTKFTATPRVPSEWFAVVSRCAAGGDVITCEEDQLETRAFVYPVTQGVTNCLTTQKYALMYSATVQDVSRASGLVFFSGLTEARRVAIATSVHSALWRA